MTLGKVAADGSIQVHPAIDCDALLVSGGYTPSVHLHSQSRGKLSWDADQQVFVPGAAAERSRCAGACRGLDALDAVLADGAAAGSAAATATGRSSSSLRFEVDARSFSTRGIQVRSRSRARHRLPRRLSTSRTT